MTSAPPPEGLREGFLALARSHWRPHVGTEDGCRSPAFDWEMVDKATGVVHSLVSVCFDNTFEEWRDGHTGGQHWFPNGHIEV